jgi:hypothetical protein
MQLEFLQPSATGSFLPSADANYHQTREILETIWILAQRDSTGTEEADLGAEALGVCGNFEESLCGAAEQQSVDHLLVL